MRQYGCDRDVEERRRVRRDRAGARGSAASRLAGGIFTAERRIRRRAHSSLSELARMAPRARRRSSAGAWPSTRSWRRATRSTACACVERANAARRPDRGRLRRWRSAATARCLLAPLGVPCIDLSGERLFGDDQPSAATPVPPTVSLTDLAWKIVIHASGRPAARRRHRGALRLEHGSQPRPLRGARHSARSSCFRTPAIATTSAILDRSAPRDAVERAADRPYALSQSVARHRPRHARLDDGLRVRQGARRCRRRAQAERRFRVYAALVNSIKADPMLQGG